MRLHNVTLLKAINMEPPVSFMSLFCPVSGDWGLVN